MATLVKRVAWRSVMEAARQAYNLPPNLDFRILSGAREDFRLLRTDVAIGLKREPVFTDGPVIDVLANLKAFISTDFDRRGWKTVLWDSENGCSVNNYILCRCDLSRAAANSSTVSPPRTTPSKEYQAMSSKIKKAPKAGVKIRWSILARLKIDSEVGDSRTLPSFDPGSEPDFFSTKQVSDELRRLRRALLPPRNKEGRGVRRIRKQVKAFLSQFSVPEDTIATLHSVVLTPVLFSKATGKRIPDVNETGQQQSGPLTDTHGPVAG